MSDAKYFSTTNKGEVFELKSDLNSDKKEKKREALKKVIASMTIGKDVSVLFPDVVNCMQTDNLELKKLVYLYIMNYAKSQPDMAIMAVNTFVKDCDDPNPLIRALAVRTMGCIRVHKITEYLCEPLRKCLTDEDPYVRKTAAVCVAKLYDISAPLVEDQGFLDQLKDLLSDSNPMVVANAIAALTEISDKSQSASTALMLNTVLVNKLLTALGECTEWGQVFILDALACYCPKDEREARTICERIIPHLAHANVAVVLSTVKVLIRLMGWLAPDSEMANGILKKLAPPLVTLLNSEPEVQYVGLRNINLIVQKYPMVMKNEMKVFFVKYNDPIYVKLEKLDIMIRLTNQNNIVQVLSELKEYATEVDVDFVRKSVRAIGRCAIKVENSAERCVSTLLDLIQTKVNYVVQEAIVVIKDIFRKYPNKYESIISTLCENLDTLDEPDARASMIWIIGEYADRIDNADELLSQFLDGFHDEHTQVQLQLLTAIVKLFLRRPTDTQQLVQQALSLATQDSDNPDLRDRGFIYWRLLSTDPGAAKQVVLAEKPLIAEETDLLEPTLLDELIGHISSLASVYHKPPSAFVDGAAASRRLGQAPGGATGGAAAAGAPAVVQTTVIPTQDSLIGDLLSLDLSDPPAMSSAPAPALAAAMPSSNVDLLSGGLDMLMGPGSPAVQHQQQHHQLPLSQPAPASQSMLGQDTVGLLGDIFGAAVARDSQSTVYTPTSQTWLTQQLGKGLEINGTFVRSNGSVCMQMTLTNHALQPMTNFALQLNKNTFGVKPAQPLHVAQPLQPHQSQQLLVPLAAGGQRQRMTPLTQLQVAIKNNIDVMYFACLMSIHVLFTEDGCMDKKLFLHQWNEIASESQFTVLGGAMPLSTDDISARLQRANIFTVAKRTVQGQDMLYLSAHFNECVGGKWALLEIKASPAVATISLAVKCEVVDVAEPIRDVVDAVLKQ